MAKKMTYDDDLYRSEYLATRYEMGNTVEYALDIFSDDFVTALDAKRQPIVQKHLTQQSLQGHPLAQTYQEIIVECKMDLPQETKGASSITAIELLGAVSTADVASSLSKAIGGDYLQVTFVSLYQDGQADDVRNIRDVILRREPSTGMYIGSAVDRVATVGPNIVPDNLGELSSLEAAKPSLALIAATEIPHDANELSGTQVQKQDISNIWAALDLIASDMLPNNS